MGTSGSRRRTFVLRAVMGIALLGVLAPVASRSTPTSPVTPIATPSVSTVERDSIGVRVGDGPTGLALDDRGRLWTVNSTEGSVSRLDSDGRKVDLKIPVGGSPQRAVWWQGALWVTVQGEDYLVRVDAKTETVTDQIAVGAKPFDVVVAEGSLWVVSSGDGTVSRVDPATRNRSAPVNVGKGARRITVGGGGIWVSNPALNRIFRVDARAGTATPLPASCRGPEGLLARDGLLWAACAGSSEAVALDEHTGKVTKRVPVKGRPDSLAHATDGNLWLSVHDGPSLRLIEPRAGYVLSEWPIRRDSGAARPSASAATAAATAPVDLTPLGRRMWLSSYGDGYAYGIDITPGG